MVEGSLSISIYTSKQENKKSKPSIFNYQPVWLIVKYSLIKAFCSSDDLAPCRKGGVGGEGNMRNYCDFVCM